MVVEYRDLGGIRFQLAGPIDARRDASGLVVSLMPQAPYAKSDVTALNPHGNGPFADLVIPELPAVPGVYAVTVDDDVMYVGIAENLRERWGPRGYSRIHPRNCFVGGQSTNCKVNAALLTALQTGTTCRLWLHVASSPRPLEVALLATLRPRWNTHT